MVRISVVVFNNKMNISLFKACRRKRNKVSEMRELDQKPKCKAWP